jgi:hypothetical protein
MATVKQLKDYLNNNIPDDFTVKVLADEGEYFDRYLKWVDLTLASPTISVNIETKTVNLGINI